MTKLTEDQKKACMVVAYGVSRGRTSEVSRLGSLKAAATVKTWRTEAWACVRADGTALLTLTRDGKEIHRFDYKEPEQ
jgi:hypothetical protein